MLKAIIVTSVLFFLVGDALAKCNRHGNCYQNGMGYNPRTGSAWSYGSNPQGLHGRDSRNNSWSYNRKAGEYHKYRSGKIKNYKNKKGKTKNYKRKNGVTKSYRKR